MVIRRNLILFAAFSLLAPLPVAPAADSVECEDRGAGWEDAKCNTTCDVGDELVLMASVDDDGWVKGDFDCGGMHAQCEDDHYDGVCTATTGPTWRPDEEGECTAEGDGGWYTHVKVWCKSQTYGGEPSERELPDVPDLSGLGDGSVCSLGWSIRCDLSAIERWFNEETVTSFGIRSLVFMEIAEGRANGVVCNAGVGCTTIVPDCALDGEGWTCRTR